MYRALIVTPWSGGGSESDPFRPLLADAFPAGLSIVDVTGQDVSRLTPSPNAYTVEVVADLATLDAIAADSRFVEIQREAIIETGSI